MFRSKLSLNAIMCHCAISQQPGGLRLRTRCYQRWPLKKLSNVLQADLRRLDDVRAQFPGALENNHTTVASIYIASIEFSRLTVPTDDLKSIATEWFAEEQHISPKHILNGPILSSFVQQVQFKPSSNLNIESLEMRRLRLDLIYVYKIMFGLVATDMSDYFSLQSTNDYSVITRRGNPYKLFVNHRRINARKNFFCELVIKVWNSLPPSIVNFESLSSFRNSLDVIPKWVPYLVASCRLEGCGQYTTSNLPPTDLSTRTH